MNGMYTISRRWGGIRALHVGHVTNTVGSHLDPYCESVHLINDSRRRVSSYTIKSYQYSTAYCLIGVRVRSLDQASIYS